MSAYFIPYTGETPAAVMIKGHRVIFLSEEAEGLEQDLNLIGADQVRQIEGGQTKTQAKAMLEKLAKEVHGGIVVVPKGAGIPEVLLRLERELPWIQ